MKASPLAQGEGVGVGFWDIYSSTTCPPLNLLLVTPVLEQDCCKLNFHPLMATGICFHCVNIFNASSCKSLPKPFLPSLVFSIMRFPDSCSTSKALSTPLGFARGLGLSLKRLEFFFLQETPCRCSHVLSRDTELIQDYSVPGKQNNKTQNTPLWSCWDNRAWEKSPIT